MALDFALTWCDFATLLPSVVEVGSTAIGHFVATPLTSPWVVREAVLRISYHLALWATSLKHIYKETNVVDDFLVSHG